MPAARPPKQYVLTFPEEHYPEEASRDLEDFRHCDYDFFEQVVGLPGKDGKSVVITEYYDCFPDPRARPGWAYKRLRAAYELLGDGHPRIVRYVTF